MSDHWVPRSAFGDETGGEYAGVRRRLGGWRDLPAYVLLGDPGSGKSVALEEECKAVGGHWLPARDLVAGIAPPVGPDRIVFIDGLDEVRAGASDGRTPFNTIRKWLFDQGRPRFRLSCREADWRGANDQADLQKVAPAEQLTVLHLAPLDEEDIHTILAERHQLSVDERTAFLGQATQSGLRAMLFNPLLLRLTVAAFHENALGRTRAGIYERACKRLISEHNERHRDLRPLGAGDLDRALEAAGLYCALLLLSGQRGVAHSRPAAEQDCITRLDLPVAIRSDVDDQALSSLLFPVRDRAAEPMHRSVAEYLGARTLARYVRRGLPVGRVLALMQGHDGAPVEALRGLWAWLAVHLTEERQALIQRDPLGFIVNADPTALGTAERTALLNSLQIAFEDNPWLRSNQWEAHPFGALVSAEMSEDFVRLLSDHRTDRSHSGFIDAILDALSVGTRLPDLAPSLAAWVEDEAQPSHLRVAAYQAWRRSTGLDTRRARAWLDAVRDGQLADPDDELCGVLLTDLYPTFLRPAEVMTYWHTPRIRTRYGQFLIFWSHTLLKATPESELPDMLDSLVERQFRLAAKPSLDGIMSRVLRELLAAALDHAGDQVPVERLYSWLGLALDEYGFSKLDHKEDRTRSWLSEHPQRIKDLVHLGYSTTRPDEDGRWPFWRVEQRLHGARLPSDWYHWQLEEASNASHEAWAMHCFGSAAFAAVNPVDGLDSPSLESVEDWLAEHSEQWPQAGQYLANSWFMPIDHWLGEQARRSRRELAEQARSRELRKEQFGPYLGALQDGSAPVGFLHDVAYAHDMGGKRPLERVRNLLVCDDSTAEKVIAALPRVLERDDVPSAEEVLKVKAGYEHLMSRPLLLAARLAAQADPDAVLRWPRPRAESLVACYLANETGDMPGWYRTLARSRPEWMAPWLIRYARPRLKRRARAFITGLWSLGQEDDHQVLAQLVVPALLVTFPLRASEPARQVLNQSLLSALKTLPDDQAAALVRDRLERPGMDVGQRISWLVADLAYRPEDSAAKLVELVMGKDVRVTMLGEALDAQEVLKRVVPQLPPRAVQSLVESLSATATPGDLVRSGIVTARHDRSDTVRALLQALASNPHPEARQALQTLATRPAMKAWAEQVQYQLTRQVAVIRSASYRPPDAMEVAATLSSLDPANPVDLRALVVDHLRHLQDHLRHGDANALRVFWRDDRATPKIENDCRDILLAELQRQLAPLNISVTPERQAADEKRMDLSVECMRDGRRIALPVEVKRTDHRRLWLAWHDQLRRLYAVDPAASGFGLYLVLWFGEGLRIYPHPEGRAVRSAQDLERLLEERIPADERFRIQVMVLDLSWPSQDGSH